MGRVTCASIVDDKDLALVAAIDSTFTFEDPGYPDSECCFASLEQALAGAEIQVVVDFTTPAAVKDNVLTCVRNHVPVVVGTTGLSTAALAEIEIETAAYGTPVLVAPNFAIGAVLMMQFARLAAGHFEACEIIELHHDGKLDAPSGTSRLTRLGVEETWRDRGIDKEPPIHSVRLPGLVAHQEIIFGGLGETLTIRHDSLARESFMPGVLLAVKRVRSLQGLVVGLENIL
ncbi:MAG: 4-hydroxy-tetrahydrodipicolinate reductase [Thermoleophilia bacterium]|nr:4-hydroxy-tetrahydrodipicolinate reductase [Thermoleophilia bacterium]